MIKYSKKGKVMQMKKRESEESLVVDYVAKEGAARTTKLKHALKHVVTGGISVSYMIYTFYSLAPMLTEKAGKENFYVFFFLSLIFMVAIPVSVIFLMFPAAGVAEEIKAARQFLEETNQEDANKNINILLDRYYKGRWEKIEDMLYETRKVPLAENMELVSGDKNER